MRERPLLPVPEALLSKYGCIAVIPQALHKPIYSAAELCKSREAEEDIHHTIPASRNEDLHLVIFPPFSSQWLLRLYSSFIFLRMELMHREDKPLLKEYGWGHEDEGPRTDTSEGEEEGGGCWGVGSFQLKEVSTCSTGSLWPLQSERSLIICPKSATDQKGRGFSARASSKDWRMRSA